MGFSVAYLFHSVMRTFNDLRRAIAQHGSVRGHHNEFPVRSIVTCAHAVNVATANAAAICVRFMAQRPARSRRKTPNPASSSLTRGYRPPIAIVRRKPGTGSPLPFAASTGGHSAPRWRRPSMTRFHRSSDASSTRSITRSANSGRDSPLPPESVHAQNLAEPCIVGPVQGV